MYDSLCMHMQIHGIIIPTALPIYSPVLVNVMIFRGKNKAEDNIQV
jgi:hypothetical protein